MTSKRSTNTRLRRTYWIAISIIATSLFLNTIIINYVISNQNGDSKIINISGRQRMLSQRLIKEAIVIRNVSPDLISQDRFELTLKEWDEGHQFLLAFNKENHNTGLDSILNSVTELKKNLEDEIGSLSVFSKVEVGALEELLSSQEEYLQSMENLVYIYEVDAREKVDVLWRLEIILTLIGLLVLAFEIIFLFRPAARYIEGLMVKLKQGEEKFRGIAEENEILLIDAETTLKELKSLNYILDQTSLFASTNLDGSISYISDKFRNLLDLPEELEGSQFYEIISTNEGEQLYIKEILATPRSEMWVGEIEVTRKDGSKMWLEMTTIPINRDGMKINMLILCNDLTKRKEADFEIERLNQDQFDAKIKLQKEKTIQIIEAQEAERERIAKDMHDGIGQMLTALKFNLQSIDIGQAEKAKKKLELVTKITYDLIKGVRMATFNLTPPELNDYGVIGGLAKLCEGLRNLTAKNIIFKSNAESDMRFDFNKEINIYRIVQEAINNSIKYSGSDTIVVTCTYGTEILSVTVDDDGVGFDIQAVTKDKNKNGSSMGLSFMEERVSYINGRIFISSAPGEGTKITINVPI